MTRSEARAALMRAFEDYAEHRFRYAVTKMYKDDVRKAIKQLERAVEEDCAKNQD